MDPAAFFSPEELAHWRGTRELFHQLYFTGLGISLLALVAIPLTGIHLALRRWAEGLANWLYARKSLHAIGRAVRPLAGVMRIFERLGRGKKEGVERTQWLVDITYPMLWVLLWRALTVPMVFFMAYVLEHELGRSNTTFALWWTDYAKGTGMALFFSGLLGLGLFGLARRLERTWWIWLWGATVVALIGWSMLSPYRARIYHEFEPLPEGELSRSIGAVLDRAGIETERIEVVDTSRRSKVANAFLMGEGSTRRVVISDNMVEKFHPREIVFAVAHEAGHEVHEHQTRDWLLTSLGALVFLLIVRLLLWRAPRIRRLGLSPHADPAILPLLFLVMKLIFLIHGPVSGYFDRAEETQADREALELTRDPLALCSVMIRLTRLNQVDPDPPAWVVWYFQHHPSMRERIAAGFEWAREHDIRIGPDALPLPAPDQT